MGHDPPDTKNSDEAETPPTTPIVPIVQQECLHSMIEMFDKLLLPLKQEHPVAPATTTYA